MNERIRLYDPELAKIVTLTGQKILRELTSRLSYQPPIPVPVLVLTKNLLN